MEYLCSGPSPRGSLVSKIRVIEKGTNRFYLARGQVVRLFMTEEAAKELSVASQVYGQVLEPVRASPEIELTAATEHVLAESRVAARVRDCIRILPQGGIGRLAATLMPETRDAAVDALCRERVLEFDFKVDHRNPAGRTDRLQVSPLGIVCKNGQVYVVGVLGLGDPPKPYALHRMANAVCLPNKPAVTRHDFDLDKYIDETHQFSFPLDPRATPVVLRLRVHKDAIYHFRERKLTPDQTEAPDPKDGQWFIVSAKVPVTTQLVPFLLSMDHWVEVLDPQEVRAETARRAHGMSAHYCEAPAPGSTKQRHKRLGADRRNDRKG